MSKKMMIFYSFPNNFSLKILNDLNDLDLNDRFFTFLRLPSMCISLFCYVSAIKF